MSWPRSVRVLLRDPEFKLGFRDMTTVMPGMLAWGLVSGVAMVKGGLPAGWALAMALFVYSAGAQLSAVAMMASIVPVYIVIAAAFCINLRFVIFSAGLRPYFVHLPFWRRLGLGYVSADLSYIVFMRRYGASTDNTPGQVPYMLGCCFSNWLGWQTSTVIGIVFADAFPARWGLGFAGVLALLGLCCSLVVDRASALAALNACVVAVLTYALPLRLNIVLAIAAAVATGMLYERLYRPATAT